MSQLRKRKYGVVLLVAALMVCAILARVASRYGYYTASMGIVRAVIYIGLLAAWGISVRTRIIQTQVRRYLLTVAGLMLLWLLLRTVKYNIYNMTAERFLWYGYYFPMLFIPVLAARLSALAKALREAQNTDAARLLLWKMAVIGAYLKRRSNLVFLADRDGMVPVSEVALCLNESMDNLRLLVQGKRDSEIGAEMHISVDAVRWHIKEVFSKTGYNNRVALACDVINKDLIVPGF